MTDNSHRAQLFQNVRTDLEAATRLVNEAELAAPSNSGSALKSALSKLWACTRALQTERAIILTEFPEEKRSRWTPKPPKQIQEPLDDELPDWPPYSADKS